MAHCHLCGKDCVAAVRYVGKWASVHKGCGILCGLYKVGVDCIHKQRNYCASHLHILNLKRFVLYGYSKQDVVYSSAKVFQAGGEAEYCHNL